MTLYARILAATGPDRELDAEISKLANGHTAIWEVPLSDGTGTTWLVQCRDGALRPPESYTCSVDAALGLVVGDDAGVSMHYIPSGKASVRITPAEYPYHWINAATPALAICAAVAKREGW